MELARSTSRGGLSVRSVIGVVLTAIVAAFLWATIAGTTAHAAPEAAWSGNAILYDTHAYAKAGPELNKKLGIDEAAPLYSYIPQEGSGPNAGSNDAFFIYFAPGTDPPKATSATYIAYTLSGGVYNNARNKAVIQVTPQGEADGYQSACSVSGIGWIICPVSVFLAESMDWIFDVIQNFLVVKPLTLTTEPSNGLYVAWNVMRSIANIAFVIAFIIIIYSQLTNIGVTNYGIKKLIPRLVVAAILVNISFYISALAIDISNVLGYSLQDVFETIRKDVFNITDDTAGEWGNAWTNLTTIILGGGGILYGIGFSVVSGAIFALFPTLILLVITMFVVLVVLAARQAIIILLVVIAPLAFVANLLPNTENLYKKWQSLFMTMLVFFPGFSLVFGGAQLAGQIIIMNANGNIITILFGMAVQIAPLAVTPLMFKLGGNLLSRIAQLANDPNKGLLDRSRKWADRKGDKIRSRTMANNPTSRWGKAWGVMNGSDLVRRTGDDEKNDLDQTKAYEQDSENRRMQKRKYGHIYEHQARADMEKERIHHAHEEHVEKLKNTEGTALHSLTMKAEAGKLDLDTAKANTEAMLTQEKAAMGSALNVANARAENAKLKNEHATATLARTVDEMKSGKLPLTGELGRITAEMKDSSIQIAAEKQGLTSAQYEVSRNIANAMKAEDVAGAALRAIAGSVAGEHGAIRARADAVASINRMDAENIKNIQDAADFPPGADGLRAATNAMRAAIQQGDDIRARAYQNIILKSGGAGLHAFRTEITDLGTNIPVDIQQYLRENLLSNHPDVKAKGNDLTEWAVNGGLLSEHTSNAAMWAGLSDKDFIAQHPKAQTKAIDSRAFDLSRVNEILEADRVGGNTLTKEVKNHLRRSVGLPEEP